MTFRIPVRFARFAGQSIPTVRVTLQQRGGLALAWDSMLIDTGSSVSVFPKGLLERRGFPVRRARRHREPIVGVGGPAPAWYLEDAILSVHDDEGGLHPFNQDRLFMVRGDIPPIMGRGLLRQMNASLFLDFRDEAGYLEIG